MQFKICSDAKTKCVVALAVITHAFTAIVGIPQSRNISGFACLAARWAVTNNIQSYLSLAALNI